MDSRARTRLEAGIFFCASHGKQVFRGALGFLKRRPTARGKPRTAAKREQAPALQRGCASSLRSLYRKPVRFSRKALRLSAGGGRVAAWMMTRSCWGIEGGATRTTVILAGAGDEELARFEAGPANLRLMEPRALGEHLSGHPREASRLSRRRGHRAGGGAGWGKTARRSAPPPPASGRGCPARRRTTLSPRWRRPAGSRAATRRCWC